MEQNLRSSGAQKPRYHDLQLNPGYWRRQKSSGPEWQRPPLPPHHRKVAMSHLGYMGRDCWLLLQTNRGPYHHGSVYVSLNQSLNLRDKNQPRLRDWMREARKPTHKPPPLLSSPHRRSLALFTWKSMLVLQKCTLLKCPTSDLYYFGL